MKLGLKLSLGKSKRRAAAAGSGEAVNPDASPMVNPDLTPTVNPS